MSILTQRLALAAMAFSVVWLAVYGSGDSVVTKHNARCENEARLIVRNPALWAEFQDESRRAFEARRKRFGPETERATIEAVPGFDQKYGPDLADSRYFRDEKIERNDIFIVHGDQIVAQYVDFTASLRSIDGATNLYCLGSHPERYALPSNGSDLN